MISSIPSDFAFKDQRDYVHGSSLGEACWQIAVDMAGDGAWTSPRLDATFARMVHANGIFWVADRLDELPARQRLSAHFRVFDENRSIVIGFEEAPDRQVNRRVPTARRIEDCHLAEPFAGFCRIDVGSTTSLLENILEANKRLHLLTVAERGVPSVLNAYMRRVPLRPHAGPDLSVLAIEHVSHKEIDGSVATLNRLRCEALSPEPFEIAYMLKFGAGV